MRRICRFRPSIRITTYHGFAPSSANRIFAGDVFTRSPSSSSIVIPARNRSIAFSSGFPLIFTKYVFGTCEPAFISFCASAQSFARIVQPPHRIHALRTFLHQIHHRRPPLGIAHRSHITLRLVQHEIQQPLAAFQRPAIHANHVPFRVGFRAFLHHHFSVERNPPRRNDLFRFASRRNSARRHNFLQSFGSHGSRRRYSGMCAVLVTSSPATSRNSFLAPERRF